MTAPAHDDGQARAGRLSPWIATPLLCVAVCLGASALGLAVNHLRPRGLRLVAAFPYEQDCPDKVQLGPTVTVEQARRLIADKRVLFLDARPREDFDHVHIPSARSLPYGFEPPSAADVASLRPYAQLVVYCDSPEDRLAAMLAEKLRQLGLPRVSVLQGGWDGWRAAGAKEGR
jgi:rhodanese-related sulfurtransferase